MNEEMAVLGGALEPMFRRPALGGTQGAISISPIQATKFQVIFTVQPPQVALKLEVLVPH